MQKKLNDSNRIKQDCIFDSDCTQIDQQSLFKKYYGMTFGINKLDYDYIAYSKVSNKVNEKKKKSTNEKSLLVTNIAKRNARERKRVEQVNNAFAELRKCIPIENRKKRVSKVRTLRVAIDYIKSLSLLLETGKH